MIAATTMIRRTTIQNQSGNPRKSFGTSSADEELDGLADFVGSGDAVLIVGVGIVGVGNVGVGNGESVICENITAQSNRNTPLRVLLKLRARSGCHGWPDRVAAAGQ